VVAREARDHRFTNAPDFPTPVRGRGGDSRRLVFDTRPHPGSNFIAFSLPVVSRFARDHRLPSVSPSGDGFART